ncbi:MAG: DUF1295 domain-containing protein [Bacteroidia bacterium]|nr:DUF1295 domain-containing protein [Bacteroidia bacterium]
MKYLRPLIPFLFSWAILLITNSFREISLINGLVQLLLFALVVCWPTWKTGRMSYVDIGWPWGLFCIGVVILFMGEGNSIRLYLVSGAYLFMGLRMGIGALQLWRKGHLDKELPRYQYQRRRWEKQGKTNLPLTMQIEVLIQGLANASFLAIPAFIISHNPASEIHILEIIGLIIWLGAFLMESIADHQKLKFLREMKAKGLRKQVCSVGLWAYSRHPNYFAEWMVWTALVIAAVPSWFSLQGQEHIVIWILLGIGLLFVSRLMYTTLVHYSGAKPSEFYSLQKRPDYRAYTERVNMFFPGPPKKKSPAADEA